MYLDANNEEETSSHVSVKEIIGFIVIVSLLLYFLFPKDKLEERLGNSEKSNTQLSEDYLLSMLK